MESQTGMAGVLLVEIKSSATHKEARTNQGSHAADDTGMSGSVNNLAHF
jgi:hypothetical protein